MVKVSGLDFAPDELGIADDDQDFDTEITLPEPPAIIKDEVFQRVAAIAGWQNVKLWNLDTTGNTYVGTKADGSKGYFIPRYDRSIDAISSVFKDFELTWSLDNYDESGFFYASDGNQSRCLDKSPAIALCKLLIAISEKIE